MGCEWPKTLPLYMKCGSLLGIFAFQEPSFEKSEEAYFFSGAIISKHPGILVFHPHCAFEFTLAVIFTKQYLDSFLGND